MTARLGHIQRALLLLADGDARSTSRIESDLLLDTGRAYGSLMGLGARGLVERDHTSGHGAILWSLTDAGQKLADDVHGLTDAPGDTPRCPHGRPEDEPCRDCREGPWRCSGCGDVVRGGVRAPHRFDVHGDVRGQRPTVTFTWAGPTV